MFALFGFAQLVLRTPAHHVDTVLHEQAQQVQDAQLTRLPGHDRQHDHAERFFHLGQLEQLVEDDLRLFVALHLDDDAHALAVALVANISDAFDLLFVDELRNVGNHARLVYLVRKLGNHNVFAVFAPLFHRSLGPHFE